MLGEEVADHAGCCRKIARGTRGSSIGGIRCHAIEPWRESSRKCVHFKRVEAHQPHGRGGDSADEMMERTQRGVDRRKAGRGGNRSQGNRLHRAIVMNDAQFVIAIARPSAFGWSQELSAKRAADAAQPWRGCADGQLLIEFAITRATEIRCGGKRGIDGRCCQQATVEERFEIGDALDIASCVAGFDPTTVGMRSGGEPAVGKEQQDR